MDKRIKDSDNAFQASLSFGFEEKEADYSLEKEDEVIQKFAGINIYQPTVDNVEMFVRKYLLNELAFFPKALEIKISITPSSFNAGKQKYIKDAQGLASFTLHDAKVEFPFLVIDGELVPFDVIQMDGQRIPYSRENLRKVLYGIDKTFQQKQQNNVVGFEPYLKVDNPVNPTTSPGFLGNVLQIQNQHMRRRGNDVYITAEHHLDEGIEKLANMKETTDEDIAKARMILESKLAKEYLIEMEKIAKEVKGTDDSKIQGLFSRIQDIQFEDANNLPNGTVITFPEKVDNELTMSNGIVVSDYMDIGGIQPPSTKIVVSSDGRIKVLSNRERFMCFKANSKVFNIPTVSLSSLQEKDVFLAFDGGKAFYPSILTSQSNRSFGHGLAKNDVSVNIYNIQLLNKDDEYYTGLFGEERPDIFNEYIRIRIAPLEGTCFLDMPYDDYILRKSKEVGIDEMNLSNLISKNSIASDKIGRGSVGPIADRLVFCTDERTTKVIKVKGIIKNFLKDKKQLEEWGDTREFDLSKTASSTDFVELRLVDKDRKVYNLHIAFADKTKRLFKETYIDFKSANEDKVRTVLKAISYDIPKISEIFYKANSQGFAHYEFPANATPENIRGGDVSAKAGNIVDKMKDYTMSAGAKIASAVSQELFGFEKEGSAKECSSRLNKCASESKALSIAFEKIAQEKQSMPMLKVAKIMSMSAMFNEKTASALNGSKYVKLVEAADKIIDAKDYLEKMAFDLVELKNRQYVERNEIVSPNYIQSAVQQIDNMFKIAGCVSCKTDVNADSADANTTDPDLEQLDKAQPASDVHSTNGVLPQKENGKTDKKASELSPDEIIKLAFKKKGFRVIEDYTPSDYRPKIDYKTASASLDELYKQAKMTVPSKEEAKKESVTPDKLVPSSDPTDGEYLNDIDCEGCHYKGKPASDGSCPGCGALLGVKSKQDNENDRSTNQISQAVADSVAAHERGTNSDYML